MNFEINRTVRALLKAVRGGAVTIQGVVDDQQALLDFARVQTIASPITLSASIQYVYSRDAGDRPFYFCGGWFSKDSGAWVGGENVDINIQTKTDGSNWVDTFNIAQLGADPSPLEFAIPHEATGALLGGIPRGFWVMPGNGVRVGIVQDVIGGGWHVWSHSFGDGVPSS